MASSKAVARKNEIRRALRAVRRVFRASDSTGEMFERRLDRLIERKTQVQPEEMDPLVRDYMAYKGRVLNLERSMADVVGIVAY